MPKLPLPILHETLHRLPGDQLQSLHSPGRTGLGKYDPQQVLAAAAASIPLGVATTPGLFAAGDMGWLYATTAVTAGFALIGAVALACGRGSVARGRTAVQLCDRGLTFGGRSWSWAAMTRPRLAMVDALGTEGVVPVPALAFDCGGRVEAFRFATVREARQVLAAVHARAVALRASFEQAEAPTPDVPKRAA